MYADVRRCTRIRIKFFSHEGAQSHKEIYPAIIGPPSLKLWRGWLWKNFAGRRCEKKAQQHSFSSAIRVYPCSSAVKKVSSL
jgi:hypothetical protein